MGVKRNFCPGRKRDKHPMSSLAGVAPKHSLLGSLHIWDIRPFQPSYFRGHLGFRPYQGEVKAVLVPVSNLLEQVSRLLLLACLRCCESKVIFSFREKIPVRSWGNTANRHSCATSLLC